MKTKKILSICLTISLGVLLLTSHPGRSKEMEPKAPTGTVDYFIPTPYQMNGLTLVTAKLLVNRSCGGSELYSSPTFVGLRPTGSSSSSPSLFTSYDTCVRTGSGAGHVLSRNVAADDTYGYWLTLNGKVVRNRHNGSPFTTPAEISTMQNTTPTSDPTTYSIAVINNDVIWNEGIYFYKTTKPEGSGPCLGIPCSFYSSTNPPKKLTAVDPDTPRILFIDGNLLRSYNLTFGDVFTVAENVSDFYVDGSWIYFAQKSGDSYQLRSVNLYNYAWFRTHYTSPADPSLQATKIAAGGGQLYWYERQGAFGGQIFMLTLPSGARSAQTDTLSGVGTMVADSTYLYWLREASPSAGVYRLSPGAAVPDAPGDMSITKMRFTQAIQVEGNLIPLVGGKATMVRVFVASTPGSHGLWQNVRARLEVEGDPMPQYATLEVLPTTSHEAVLNETFNFMLREADTIEGSRHLTATLFSLSGRREDNRTNNIYSTTITFGPSRELSAPVFEYSNIHRGVDCHDDQVDGYVTPWNNVVSHMIDTQGMWPVSVLTLYPLPGVDPPAIEDSNCGAYLRAVDQMKEWIDHAYPSGGQKVVIMQPDSGHPGGTHWPAAHGNSVINVQDYFPDHALAHEFGHSYPGVYHSNHTWDAGSHYPRAAEPNPNWAWSWLGDYIGMQTYTTTRLIIGSLNPSVSSHDAWDLMSYGPRSWPSPYTYCKTLKYMSGGSVCCPDTVEGGCSSPDRPSEDADALRQLAQQSLSDFEPGIVNNPARPDLDPPYLYVSGWITSSSEASFKPFEIVNSSKNISTPGSGSDYHIKLLDKNSSTLYDYSFDNIQNHRDTWDLSGPVAMPSLYSAYLPWDSSTMSITLDYKGAILARRLVSAHAPIHVVQAFAPTEPVTGTWTLKWIASDEDSDPLVFSVWYSRDNGSSWIPVQTGIPDSTQQADIHFNLLPGCNPGEGLLRVLASDGVLTTESRTETSFGVEHKPPTIRLVPTYAPDGNITQVRAIAYDLDDGVISDPDMIHWSDDWDEITENGVIFNPDVLTPGDHILTVWIYDTDGMYAATTIKVHVPGNPFEGGLVVESGQPGTMIFNSVLPMTLTVPSGAVDQPVRFSARISPDIYFDPPGAVGPSFEIEARDQSGLPVHSYYVPLDLVIDYASATYSQQNESSAFVYTWNADEGTWEKQDTTVDIFHHRTTTKVYHTSQFVLVIPDNLLMFMPFISK